MHFFNRPYSVKCPIDFIYIFFLFTHHSDQKLWLHNAFVLRSVLEFNNRPHKRNATCNAAATFHVNEAKNVYFCLINYRKISSVILHWTQILGCFYFHFTFERKLFSYFHLFFFWFGFLLSHSIIFHLYGNVTIIGEVLKMLTVALHLGLLNRWVLSLLTPTLT